MGLGPSGDVSLARARDLAAEARRQLREGIDPIDARRSASEVVTRIPSWQEFVEELLGGSKGGVGILEAFRNPKHAAQWRTTLGPDYAKSLQHRLVSEIDTADVLGVLRPIWIKTPETAARLRGRIERVLAAAKARGYRDGPNPALWRGHLDALLPPRRKLSRGHHAALPYAELPAFWQRLARLDSSSAWALSFAVLTAARSGEVRLARWAEIDLNARIWTVPAARMKAGREHRVPLSTAAVAILSKAGSVKLDADGYLFPSHQRDRPLSVMALPMALRGLDASITVHGFRSAFRDWAAEATAHPHEVAEMALAHTISSAVERAYRRGDLFEKRVEIMKDWANFVCSAKA